VEVYTHTFIITIIIIMHQIIIIILLCMLCAYIHTSSMSRAAAAAMSKYNNTHTHVCLREPDTFPTIIVRFRDSNNNNNMLEAQYNDCDSHLFVKCILLVLPEDETD